MFSRASGGVEKCQFLLFCTIFSLHIWPPLSPIEWIPATSIAVESAALVRDIWCLQKTIKARMGTREGSVERSAELCNEKSSGRLSLLSLSHLPPPPHSLSLSLAETAAEGKVKKNQRLGEEFPNVHTCRVPGKAWVRMRTERAMC